VESEIFYALEQIAKGVLFRTGANLYLQVESFNPRLKTNWRKLKVIKFILFALKPANGCTFANDKVLTTKPRNRFKVLNLALLKHRNWRESNRRQFLSTLLYCNNAYFSVLYCICTFLYVFVQPYFLTKDLKVSKLFPFWSKKTATLAPVLNSLSISDFYSQIETRISSY